MSTNNDLKNINTKNFITQRSTSENHNFKVNSQITEHIYGRRHSQYIAGEIIEIFSIKDENSNSKSQKLNLNQDIKAYFLIISENFRSNYLVCPVFLKPVLECSDFKPYEANLGIVPELSTCKILYADVSRSHFVNKDEFLALIDLQGKLMEKDKSKYCVTRIQHSKLRSVIKVYKNLISN